MVAFHFPPVKVSSSVQRTLKFSSYLLEYNWQAIVLTVKPGASSTISNEQLEEVPEELVVKHCLALDASRHLSIRGKYFSWMALPDRWWTWIITGLFSGIFLIKKYQPEIIWSTYPILSANFIALFLSRLFNITWIADLRDPIIDEWFPSQKLLRKIHHFIDKKVVENANKIVFTSPGTLELYKRRYPEQAEDKWVLIRNGYDEKNFIDALPYVKNKKAKLTLLHSGIIYPDDRDPISLFDALCSLKNQQNSLFVKENFQLILRATGHDKLMNKMIKARALDDIVKIKPVIEYNQALAEMMSVDGLIVMQACSCNHQTPAKVYEYLRAEKPILLLSDQQSDSFQLLKKIGAGQYCADLNNSQEIERILYRFIENIKSNKINELKRKNIEVFSRQHQTKKLAQILNSIKSK